MMTALLDWLDDRTGYRLLLHEALNEPIPGGARWRYVWGSTLSFVFMIQMITGFFLWTAYSPSTITAWESVYYIQNVMQYGWLVRGIHVFSAQAMVVLLAVHFLQIVWDGAYKAPREVNFWLGLILMQIVFGLALTGYLLPWDQKGYYATQVATKIAGATPVVGQQVQELVQGGKSYGHHTLTRFFALHAGLLPALLAVFLGLHIYVFRRHGITTPDPKAPPGTFWPEQVLKDAVACLAVLVVILAFVFWKGAELSAPADPAEEYPARPEWYFLFLFRFLKYEAVEHYGLAFGAIYVPGLIMAVIALMPFTAKLKGGHRFNLLFTFALILGAGYLTGLAMKEDKDDDEFQAKLRFAERDAHRAVVLSEHEGIPALGARELLANDPYTQGPRLFARNCANCHRYNGHDSMGLKKYKQVVDPDGNPVLDAHGKPKKEEEVANSADLGDFGSREWVKNVLVDYHAVFAPMQSELAHESYGDKGKEFLVGAMANWSDSNKAKLLDSANADDLKALVEFVVSDSGRYDVGAVDESLAAKGRAIFESGTLTNGSIDACGDCHLKKLADGTEVGNADAPNLTKYAGKEWLTAFLKNPGHADFYGEKNLMPAYETTFSEKEMRLIVDWMVGDYYRAEERHAQSLAE
jgi:ubiquinol-cytochrome c reductase cytochrome b subunit